MECPQSNLFDQVWILAIHGFESMVGCKMTPPISN
jgi:hypothetical protein